MAEQPYTALITQASRQMLGKDHPEGREDWVKVMNFVAWNTEYSICLQVCLVVVRSNNVPLKKDEVEEIVNFQTYSRGAGELARREKTREFLSDEAIARADDFLENGAGKPDW